MMKRKLTMLLAVVFTFSILFSAYSTSNASAKAASALKGEITYWSMWNETEAQAVVLKDAIADFEKQNPGTKINVQWCGREIRKTLVPALDAGQKIDLWDEDCERIVKNYQKYSLNLDSYFAKTYPTTNGKAYKDTVMKSLQQLVASFATDKKLYAVPYQPMMIAFMYNKDHFKQAGIKSVPKTWAEFLVVCEKLKKAGFTPMTNDDAYCDLPLGYHLARYIGVKQVEALVKDKSGKKWDNPIVKKAIKDYENLAKKGYISKDFASNKWPAGQQEVANGMVSMYLNGTWLPNEIMNVTGPEFNWGQFAYPTVAGGVDKTTAGIYGAQGFQISKKSKAPDVAFAFAVHMTTGKWDKELSAKTYGAPMSTATPWPKQIADEKAIFNTMKTVYPWGAGVDADSDKLPILNSNFTKLCTGKITADQFLKNVKGNVK